MARILAAMVSVRFWVTFWAVAGLMPLSAGALGLGEIDLKSALNQPFSAEIPVASNAPGEADDLLVEVASRETFQQFGLDRATFLSDFRFTVVNRESGAVVEITSPQPIVEPFVTLLLEISWAQGRLLREYTVLLDPPVFATESVQPAVAAPTAAPVVSAPRQTAQPPAAMQAPRTAPPVAQTTSPVTTSNDSSAAGGDGGSYGPVKRTDTLWKIAGQLVAESPAVSRNQMMLAIYQANPEAFSGNINRLKAGMILRVPSAREVAIGGREATSEVRRQNEQWRAARNEQQGGRLRLVPPPERDTKAAETGGGATGVDRQSAAATEAGQQLLQGRVGELEGRLADSQRQLQIRDQELATLQRQLAEFEGQSIEGQSDAAEPATLPDVAEADAPLEPDLLADSDNVPADQAADVEKPEVAPAPAPAPVDVTPAQTETAKDSVFTNPLVYISLIIVVLLAWLFARNRSKNAESVPGRWDELDSVADAAPTNEVSEATTRLHAKPPEDAAFVVEEAPSPDETSDEGSAASFSEGSSEEWGGFVDESETPLERTISTDAAVNLDQADPMAESDFHMAYGLYDQAADLLTKAVEVEPERKDLRMKLLEVYFIWEHQEGFLQAATDLQSRVDTTSDPDWNKVLIMGKQICPDEGLFSGDATPVSSGDSVDLDFGDDTSGSSVDLQFDEAAAGSLDMQFDDESADSLGLDGGENADADMIDFDLGSEDEATQVVENIGETISEEFGLEISGDAPTLETPTIESPAVHGAADSTLETPTLESPALDDAAEATMETPTLESPALDISAAEATLETPTLESPALDDSADNTAETPTIESRAGAWDDADDQVGDETDDDPVIGSDQTAEIDLDDLDLDLSGFDDLDDDLLGEDSAIVEAEADDDAEPESVQFDGLDDETRQQPVASLDDISDEIGALDELADDVDSTAEMRNLDSTSDGGDTVEQPTVGGGDTAEQPGLSAVPDDADREELAIGDDFGVGVGDLGAGGGVDGATMTEVGTKLDLARAYIDMGDPEGARSILSEVLEEADSEQKQIAQKLLEDIAD